MSPGLPHNLIVKWSLSVVSDSLWPHGLQPSRLLHPWDFPGKSTGVGCHCLQPTPPLKNCESLYCTPVSYNTVHQLYFNRKKKEKEFWLLFSVRWQFIVVLWAEEQYYMTHIVTGFFWVLCWGRMWRVESKNRSWQIHCEATAIIYLIDDDVLD